MSTLAHDHVRQKRAFAPPPRLDATRLFEKAGPELTVCVHPELGFMVGVAPNGRAMWSHDRENPPRLSVDHPDVYRTAASWLDDAEAGESLRSVLTRREWEVVCFVSAIADVAEPPPSDGTANVTSSPTAMCSIESCHRSHDAFPPQPHHRLDPKMRRVASPRTAMGRVSLAPVGAR